MAVFPLRRQASEICSCQNENLPLSLSFFQNNCLSPYSNDISMHLFFSECMGQDAISFLLNTNFSVSMTQILVPVILTFSKRSAGKKKE